MNPPPDCTKSTQTDSSETSLTNPAEINLPKLPPNPAMINLIETSRKSTKRVFYWPLIHPRSTRLTHSTSQADMGNPADDIYEPLTDPEDATKFVARVILTQIYQIPREFVVDDWIKMDWRNGAITHHLRTPTYNSIITFCIFIGTEPEFVAAKRSKCPYMGTSQ